MSGSSLNKCDDHTILSALTSFNKKTSKNLSQLDFTGSHDRILDDLSSTISHVSAVGFWNDLVSKATSLGFTYHPGVQTNDQTASHGTTTEVFPAPFDSNDAKHHLAAVSALIGITEKRVKDMTEHVFEIIEHENNAKGLTDDGKSVHSMLGTKELLLRVRDYYHGQQIDRIRIITEAIRVECSDEVDMDQERSDLRNHCIAFLNSLDERNTWSSSSRETGQGPFLRGLFKILVSLACAPVKRIGRDEIYRACELRDGRNTNDSISASLTFPSTNFARELMTDHLSHYDAVVRTESLVALFMLLYERIDGGIDRSDYVLLLQALNGQEFFAKVGGGDKNSEIDATRRCQLTALILAECMSLWSTAMVHARDDGDQEWIASHPFLSNAASARNEVEIIGRLLQQELTNKVLERRRIYMSQAQTTSSNTGDIEDDKFDAPEAIALLTFGLLIKLCHSGVEEGSWASDMGVKGLAVDCVSTANDDCGAFGYLGSIMAHLLPSELSVDSRSSEHGELDLLDWNHLILNGSDESKSGVLKITKGDGSDIPQDDSDTGEDNAAVIYASIGREILVATLSAFKSSVSRSLESAKVDNLGMFCQLAAKLHRNSNVLCERFWMDWEATPQTFKLSEATTISAEQADPLVFLLDIAHSVAICALDTLGDRSQEHLLSVDGGRQEAVILPFLSPLLSFLASLIPMNSDAATIISTFIPRGMMHVCLLGVYHVCSKENALPARNSDTIDEFKRQAEAARQCIEALCAISSIAAEEKNGDCTEWLRQATQNETAKAHLQGPTLLHAIAEASSRNPAMENTIASDITSNVLCTISYLCYNGHENVQWICKVGQSFSSVRDDGFRSFAAHVNKVTISFTSLLLQMTRSVADVCLAEDGVSYEPKIEFMRTIANGTLLACDIIASSPQPLDLPHSHRSILINAFRTVTSSLRIMDAITHFHESDDIRDEARSVLDGILNALSTSTSLGSNIAFFATMPITMKLAAVTNSHFEHTNKNGNAIIACSGADETKDNQSRSLAIESLPAPSSSVENFMSLSSEAVSLISAWNSISEQVALESITVDQASRFSELDMNELSLFQRKTLSSVIMSLGPARLLFSSAPMCHAPDMSITFFTLLVKYCVWHSESTSEDVGIFADIAITSLGVVASAMLHAKLDLSSNLVPSLEVSTQIAGRQLHNALPKLLTNAKNADSKNVLLLVKIMDIVRLSAINHPSLCRLIVNGQSNDESLVESMVDLISLEQPIHSKESLVVSVCLHALQTIWKTCREYHSSAVSTLSKSVHPCDDVVRSLLKSDCLVKRCISLCDKFSTLVTFSSDVDESDAATILHHTDLFNILRMSIQIIEVDAQTNLRHQNESGNLASIKYLKGITNTNNIEHWIRAIGSNDSILTNAIAIKTLNDESIGSGLNFTFPGSCELISTRVLLKHLPYSESKEAFESKLEGIGATNLCVISEYQLLETVSRFGALLLKNRQELEADNFDWIIKLTEQAVETLYALVETGLAAHLETAMFTKPPSASVGKCGTTLLTLITTCLSVIPLSQGGRGNLVLLLDKILRSSERILTMTHSNDDEDSSLLRLNSMSCALSLVNSLQESDSQPLPFEEQQRYKASRLGFCRFVCRTLHDLQYAKERLNQNAQQQSEATHMQTNILLACLSLMTTITLSAKVDDSKGANAFQSFPVDLADALRGCNALESISYHLDAACKSATTLSRQKGSPMLEHPMFEVIDCILTFALALCESKERSLAELMSKGQFVQVILRNSITTSACERWTKTTNAVAPSTLSSRGYIEISQSTMFFSSKSQYHNVSEDPAHKIWLTTLRVFAGLLHSTSNISSHAESSSTGESAAALVIDFLHFYEIPITSFIECCLVQAPKAHDSSNSTSPSSGLGLSVATLNELSDIMALISELCSGGHRKQFENSSPRLYAIMSNAALAVCRSLSSFLGALGTAREIFFALNSLNDVMEKGSTARQYDNFRMHPLLADGVPNAKHQAIRNALYANSCCTCMTLEEHSLSLRGRPDKSQNKTEDLEQSFHSHVNNDFIFLMEETASQCIFSALSVVHKVHPSTSAFVTFTEEEAAHLNLSSVPPIGAMVGIRQESVINPSPFFPSPSEMMRHGRVIHYNAISKTLDVEYFDHHGIAAERGVGVSRLAALEDISKRVNVFQYKPAPESVSDSAASNFTGAASIGNLILILRWCQQHAQRSTVDRPALELKGIVNLASIILGNEVGVHLELDSPTFASEQERKSINSQLLALFDDEVTLQSFDLTDSTDSISKSAILQTVTDPKVWKSVQSQVESILIAARVDFELARRNAEQAGPVGSQYWGRRTPTGSSSRSNSRRSPFS